MIRRLALLAVLVVAAACTPGTSPSDGLETTPPLTTPDASLETTMPSTDLPTESPSESPITSP
ncbi:MAG TPA: hypothetical protein VFX65_05535 [Candidatus Limnocylindrales bacterium]|nr:hypothetical protein [Candidatus Limnocylindrales bacterium]